MFNGHLHWTVVLTPLVLLSLITLTLGLHWMLASLGVFLRDVGQTTRFLRIRQAEMEAFSVLSDSGWITEGASLLTSQRRPFVTPMNDQKGLTRVFSS